MIEVIKEGEVAFLKYTSLVGEEYYALLDHYQHYSPCILSEKVSLSSAVFFKGALCNDSAGWAKKPWIFHQPRLPMQPIKEPNGFACSVSLAAGELVYHNIMADKDDKHVIPVFLTDALYIPKQGDRVFSNDEGKVVGTVIDLLSTESSIILFDRGGEKDCFIMRFSHGNYNKRYTITHHDINN